MGETATFHVPSTVKTAFVTFKTDPVLAVSLDGRDKPAVQVRYFLLFNIVKRFTNKWSKHNCMYQRFTFHYRAPCKNNLVLLVMLTLMFILNRLSFYNFNILSEESGMYYKVGILTGNIIVKALEKRKK